MHDRGVNALSLALGLSLIGAGVTLAAPVAASFRTPHETVAALYKLPSIPTRPATMRRFFTGDLAVALIKDSHSDGVGAANDSDYRYDAQDMKITAFHIEDYANGAGTSVIRAHFKNFGKPDVVTYNLCLHGPNDWRISDVGVEKDSLRKLLGLAPVEAMKGC